LQHGLVALGTGPSEGVLKSPPELGLSMADIACRDPDERGGHRKSQALSVGLVDEEGIETPV